MLLKIMLVSMDWIWTTLGGGLLTFLFIKFLWPFLVSSLTDWASKKAVEQLSKKKDDFIGQMLRGLDNVSNVDSKETSINSISKEQFEEATEKINRKLDLLVKLMTDIKDDKPQIVRHVMDNDEDDIFNQFDKAIEKNNSE